MSVRLYMNDMLRKKLRSFGIKLPILRSHEEKILQLLDRVAEMQSQYVALESRLSDIERRKENLASTCAELGKAVDSLNFILNLVMTPADLPPAVGPLRYHQERITEFAWELVQELEDMELHPLLTAGSLLGALRNGRIIPWDDDMDFDLLRKEFDELVNYVKEKPTFVYAGDYSSFSEYEKAVNSVLISYPNEVVWGLTPYMLSALKGTSYEDVIIIDFFSRDFVNENLTEEEYIKYKQSCRTRIYKAKTMAELFAFERQELSNSKVFVPDSSMTARGWGGANLFTAVFVPKDDVLPFSKIFFEGRCYFTYRHPEVYMRAEYPNFHSFPKNIEPLIHMKLWDRLVKSNGWADGYYIDPFIYPPRYKR